MTRGRQGIDFIVRVGNEIGMAYKDNRFLKIKGYVCNHPDEPSHCLRRHKDHRWIDRTQEFAEELDNWDRQENTRGRQ